MKDFLFGLRLLFGAGRGSRARFLLMAVGGSIGVCCLAVVLTIPAILNAHDARAAAREPDTGRVRSAHPTLELDREDPHGSRPLTRVFIARGTPLPASPPGLSELPHAGEVFASPALRDLLRTEPSLRQVFPGRVVGTIGQAGLADPDELYAYIGMNRSQLHGASGLRGWGSKYGPDNPAIDESTLGILRFALACLVLLPLGVFLSICARLSAASRARRLAALRLVGLSARRTQRVNAAETVVAAVLGALLGLGEYLVFNQVVARTGLPGFKWYASDGGLSAGTVAVCLIGCPLLAGLVSRISARKATVDPLSARRSAVPAPPASGGSWCWSRGWASCAGTARPDRSGK